METYSVELMIRLIVYTCKIDFIASQELIWKESIVLPNLNFNFCVFQFVFVHVRKFKIEAFVV